MCVCIGSSMAHKLMPHTTAFIAPFPWWVFKTHKTQIHKGRRKRKLIGKYAKKKIQTLLISTTLRIPPEAPGSFPPRCPGCGNDLQRPKLFSVPGCKHVCICYQVGHYNTRFNGDWHAFGARFKWPVEELQVLVLDSGWEDAWLH